MARAVSKNQVSDPGPSWPSCYRVENIVGKEENAGYQHCLLFPQCFQKASFSGSLQVGIM